MPKNIGLSEYDYLRFLLELFQMQVAEMNAKTLYDTSPEDQPGLKDMRLVAWREKEDKFEGAKHILGVLGFSNIMEDIEDLRRKVTVI